MLGWRKTEKLIRALMTLALLFALSIVCFPHLYASVARESSRMEYPEQLFGRDVIEMDIEVSEDTWADMLENKMSKPYISCDMTINGQRFDSVGLRPKGNSSLTSTNGPRISFRLDFDHYINNQTCFGLTQMVLNNLQADATYMKDYIAYDLMQRQGVNAPLHTFAFLTLNGEPFGVYLAAEVYNETYLERVYQDTSIRLYNVKSSGLDTYEDAVVDSETAEVLSTKGRVQTQGMESPGGAPPGGPPGNGAANAPGGPPSNGAANVPGGPPGNGAANVPGGPPGNGTANVPGGPPGNGTANVPSGPPGNGAANAPGGPPGNGAANVPGGPPGNGAANVPGGPGGAPPGGGGGDLVYTNDNTSSYTNIFANAVFNDTDASDYARVIRAIKYLNKENVTEEELETYWNVDEVLRYLAVHTFMVNGDSYSGSMMQNYYLAEQNGRVMILPWDYNLSFGAFGGPGGPPGMEENRQPTEEARLSAGNDANQEMAEAINLPIDTPMMGVDMAERPLISVLLGRETYRTRYRQYLSELSAYASDAFLDKLTALEANIWPYVQRESESFYTPEEQQAGFQALKEYIGLHCKSIQGQLNGSIPATTEGQEAAADTLIQATFSVEAMGSMRGGGGDGNGPPDGGGMGAAPAAAFQAMPPMMGGNMAAPPMPPEGMFGGGGPPVPPDMFGGQQRDNSSGKAALAAVVALGLAIIGALVFPRTY